MFSYYSACGMWTPLGCSPFYQNGVDV